MRILIAPDKFKGTATAAEVADAVAAVLRAAGHEVVTQPLADGGDGTLEAFGGPNRTSTVTGPLGELVEAAWRYGSGRTAVVEMAQASGLALVGGPDHNDAVVQRTHRHRNLRRLQQEFSAVLTGVKDDLTQLRDEAGI